MDISKIWSPQPGPQVMACVCPADIVFFGGSRGGGKTDCALGRQILGAMSHGYKWNGLFIRKNYKHFAELRRRIKELIRFGLPAELKGGDTQTNRLIFQNGAMVLMTAIERADKLEFFQGQQFTEISIEEGCQFGFIDEMIEKLKGCMRSPHGLECKMFITGNPGGAGHGQIQSRFKLGRIGLENGVRPGQFIRDESGTTMVFVPSSVDDNKILCDHDPQYVNRLKSIKDPMLRRAWLEGDWDVIMGGFFTDVWSSKNVLPIFRVPPHWPRLVGFDFGSAKPFSVGWYAVSGGEFIPEIGKALPRGALIRFYEWYGCVKDQPNTGIKLDSPKIAERMVILEAQHRLLGHGASIDRIADPAIFKQEDGPSISEKMAAVGVVWRRGDNQRIPGWDTLRGIMRGRIVDTKTIGEGENAYTSAIYEPMFYVTENNKHFLRTIPTIERDEHNFEDIDTTLEDHIADEVRYVAMARPQAGPREEVEYNELSPMAKEFAQIETQLDETYDDMMTPNEGLYVIDDPLLELARW